MESSCEDMKSSGGILSDVCYVLKFQELSLLNPLQLSSSYIARIEM